MNIQNININFALDMRYAYIQRGDGDAETIVWVPACAGTQRFELGYFMTPWIDDYDGDGAPPDKEIIDAAELDCPDYIRTVE